MRHPRERDEGHLRFVRGLPCLVCGDNTSTEAAHIRYSDLRAGKRNTGMQERPDDCFTVPQCGKCHRAQHSMNERLYWEIAGIDPVFVALALWAASGDQERGEQIVQYAQKNA